MASVNTSKAKADFKLKLKDAQYYLKGKKSGTVPKLIRQLWALEVERDWTNTVSVLFQRRIRKQLDRKLKKSQHL